jgi:hypothetical protein
MERYLHDDPRMPHAWGPWFSHEYITYFSVLALPEIMELPPVRVRPNPGLHDERFPIGPKHVDLYKESYRDARQLDPLKAYDYAERNGEFSPEPPVQALIEPWKVLVIYSTEPDLLADCDLYLNRRQKITGGSHGWRHMEFRLPGLTIGMASESFRYHTELAQKAFALGNDYWGWRFLSRATHYLADLGHPFHVKASPAGFLLKNLFSPARTLQVLSATHTGYEVYSERRFREGHPAFRLALTTAASQGRAAGGSVYPELEGYIRTARSRLNPIFRFIVRQFGQELIDAYASLDRNGLADVAVQTRMCSAEAAGVIFRDSNISALEYLDGITAEILKDVGRMLGMLLAGFAAGHAGRAH